ncbi:endonuclease NucS domain-containing protein [Pseudodesulfovibrio sp.]|uniref:endonuclease NucS domain-containing protein n=1 Tax=unclassified Pseudodesulfovibrio TaxID=2661612 RepID=UPI003B002004
MKSYFRIMLGKGSVHADECHKGGFIGADFGIEQDLTNDLPEEWREFNKKFIPVYLKNEPEKSKVAAGLACGALWTVSKGVKKGDIVLCPDGNGSYLVGELSGSYQYHPGQNLPHRRPVNWYHERLDREDMSEALRNSCGSIGTVSNVTKYKEELDKLISGTAPAPIIATDETIEDPACFALEKHLEDFLVNNWSQTELGKDYDIFENDGELAGRQYPTDTGPLDILAVSKDKKTLLVVELKKGRASDSVIGQILRYMGFVRETLAEDSQEVKGVIVALEDDLRTRRALSVTPNVEFYRYHINFTLTKVDTLQWKEKRY